MRKTLVTFLALVLFSCNTDNKKTSSESKSQGTEINTNASMVFGTHHGLAEAASKQIWKEILLGDYIQDDIKMYDLGKQASKDSTTQPYQIMSYGYQVKGDKEIFRISLRADLKDNQMFFQLNEEQYYSCRVEDFISDDFAIVMKTAVGKLLAEFMKRKMEELE